MGRSPCCDKSKVKRGSWSPEEDATLKNYLYKHGTGGNWIALPQKAGLKRCGKSCRLRWLNYLRPDIKHGAFTQEEENIIFYLYNTIGSRWSVIASHLPGRTDNDVKNYWNTKLKKKVMAEHGNSPTTSNMTTTITTTVAASNVAEAVPGTTTTATVVDMTPTFQSPTNSLDLVPTFSMPFLQDNSTTLNANATSIISYDPINCFPPRFIVEGSNNYSNENNIDPFSPINQDSSNFKPSSLEMDENYGFKGIPMDEYSYEVLSGVWSQIGSIEDDSNTDLFSNFQVDSKPQGASQSHLSILE